MAVPLLDLHRQYSTLREQMDKAVLDVLEHDLGKPVLSTNQALLWGCLRACGVGEPVESFGSLLASIESDA